MLDFLKKKEPIYTKEKAKQVGNKCPHCGETRRFHSCITKNTTPSVAGISMMRVSNERNGLFDGTLYHRFHFYCYTCDFKWKSPLYIDTCSLGEPTIFI